MYVKKMIYSFLENSWSIPASMVCAFIVSLIAPTFSKSISEFGDIYISFFLLAIIPYYSVTIIISIANLLTKKDSHFSLTKWSVIYFFLYCLTSSSAMIMANFLELGTDFSQHSNVAEIVRNSQTSNFQEINLDTPIEPSKKMSILSFLVTSVPDNIFSALSKGIMIQVIVFSILFGIAVGLLPLKRREFIIKVIDNLVDPFRSFINAAILCLPIGIFFIMSKYLSAIEDPTVVIYLWKFLMTIIVSVLTLAVMATIIAAWKLKIPYFQSVAAFRKASILALSTGESLAGLPSLIEGIEKETKLNKDSVNFLIPMGISLFEFGTVFYYSFLTVFTADVYHIPLHLTDYILILITVYFAMASETHVPLISLSIVFTPLGLPMIFLNTFIILVDWMIHPFLVLYTTILNYAGCVLVANNEN